MDWLGVETVSGVKVSFWGREISLGEIIVLAFLTALAAMFSALLGLYLRSRDEQQSFQKFMKGSPVIRSVVDAKERVRERLNMLIPLLREQEERALGSEDPAPAVRFQLAISLLLNCEKVLHDAAPVFKPQHYLSLVYHATKIQAVSPPNLAAWLTPEMFLYLVLNHACPSDVESTRPRVEVMRRVFFNERETDVQVFRQLSLTRVLREVHSKLHLVGPSGTDAPADISSPGIMFSSLRQYRDGTAREIRLLGNRLAAWQALLTALQVAHAHAFKEKVSHGDDTEVWSLWQECSTCTLLPEHVDKKVLRQVMTALDAITLEQCRPLGNETLRSKIDYQVDQLASIARDVDDPDHVSIPDFAMLEDDIVLFPKGTIEQTVIAYESKTIRGKDDHGIVRSFELNGHTYTGESIGSPVEGRVILHAPSLFQSFQEYWKGLTRVGVTEVPGILDT
jgi:hypothetical protein